MAMEAKTGGGGTSGGMQDEWKISVDRQLGQLHGDVRNLLYGLIGGFLFVISAGGVAYVKLSDQVGEVRTEQARISGKLDLLIERMKPTEPAKR